jgi:exodeoxyribonuclease V alpha subunit
LLIKDEELRPEGADTEITGAVEHITFRNDENGYTVARFQTERSGIVTATGRFAAINEGEHLTLYGRWTEHQRFGRQFEVVSYRVTAPATLKGMEKYLASGLIPGIGPVFARRIVEHFKDEVFRVIDETPERIREVPGIGAKKAQSLVSAFRKQKSIRNLMMFLQEHGVSATLAIKVYKEYGDDSVRVLKENPYMLAEDIFGVGFKTADSVARKLGMPDDDPRRYRAGVHYVLQEASNDGHVYLPRQVLLTEAGQLLDADIRALEDAVKDLVLAGKIVDDNGKLYIEFLYRAEKAIAEKLADLSSGKLKDSLKGTADDLIHKIQRIENMELAPEQFRAVKAAFENRCLVITGGPGTGKSTCVRVIVRMFEQLGKSVRLASPTGRAAKRLEEATGRPASTIHRLLEYNPQMGFGRNADVPIECKVLVVDEASMLDIPLAFYLMRALPTGCRLILVGDVDQLPSVGPGCLLRDVIDSGVVHTVALTQIFRQAAGSLIVTNAHRINSGKGPTYDPMGGEKDFRWAKEEDKEEIGNKVIALISSELGKRFDPLTQIQVLTPMHAGPAGARELNRRLQEACNPPSPKKDELKVGERLYRHGDRVMQIRNNYELEVFNGDIGTIVGIDNREGNVAVQFDRLVTYKRSSLDELVLAYAITVHKSQGSEYPCVVIPLTVSHWIMLQRNLLYTAITRAKKFCVIVGMRKALWRAISNAHTSERYTQLMIRLREFAGKSIIVAD